MDVWPGTNPAEGLNQGAKLMASYIVGKEGHHALFVSPACHTVPMSGSVIFCLLHCIHDKPTNRHDGVLLCPVDACNFFPEACSTYPYVRRGCKRSSIQPTAPILTWLTPPLPLPIMAAAVCGCLFEHAHCVANSASLADCCAPCCLHPCVLLSLLLRQGWSSTMAGPAILQGGENVICASACTNLDTACLTACPLCGCRL